MADLKYLKKLIYYFRKLTVQRLNNMNVIRSYNDRGILSIIFNIYVILSGTMWK